MQNKDYSWNPSTCICENSTYLESTADTSAIKCDEFIFVMDIVLTKMTNTKATNVSKKCQSKKVRVLYFAYSFISDHITIDNYFICYNANHR